MWGGATISLRTGGQGHTTHKHYKWESRACNYNYQIHRTHVERVVYACKEQDRTDTCNLRMILRHLEAITFLKPQFVEGGYFIERHFFDRRQTFPLGGTSFLKVDKIDRFPRMLCSKFLVHQGSEIVIRALGVSGLTDPHRDSKTDKRLPVLTMGKTERRLIDRWAFLYK